MPCQGVNWGQLHARQVQEPCVMSQASGRGVKQEQFRSLADSAALYLRVGKSSLLLSYKLLIPVLELMVGNKDIELQ